LSGTPGEVGDAPPLLGQHTTDVLRELGYKDDDIAKLKKAGAI
jgi:crotonobetainyl-CoA:carnitine CoA-transferase CaiB-like acyl-CoA transferase